MILDISPLQAFRAMLKLWGLTNAEIKSFVYLNDNKELHLSDKTIRNYTSSMNRKFNNKGYTHKDMIEMYRKINLYADVTLQ